MGIGDPAVYDGSDGGFLDDIELLCQLGGVRPTVADVTGPALVSILRASLTTLRCELRFRFPERVPVTPAASAGTRQGPGTAPGSGRRPAAGIERPAG